MAFKILSPEEAKKRARANVAEWLRQKEIEEKKARIEAKRSPKPEQNTRPKTQNPLSDSLIRDPNPEVFIPRKTGATMEEAFARAEKEKRVIASNRRLDQALVGSDEWESINPALWYWTGTMTAYERAGEPFGEVVEYTNDKTGMKYLFEVPKKYQGKKDAVLVAEHPDYSLEIKGDGRIIRSAKVDLIEKFPVESHQWYLTDPIHGIPFGDVVDETDPNARFLYRIDKRVGSLARSVGTFDNAYRRSVYAGDDWSEAAGVAPLIRGRAKK